MDRTRPGIFITRLKDDTYLAVSVETPRFCVSASSEDEARRKAARARAYYHAARG